MSYEGGRQRQRRTKRGSERESLDNVIMIMVAGWTMKPLPHGSPPQRCVVVARAVLTTAARAGPAGRGLGCLRPAPRHVELRTEREARERASET